MVVYLISIIFGLTTAWLWSVYIQATSEYKAGRASLSDLAIMFTSTLMLQLWKETDITVLLTFDVAAAIGTYISVKRGKRNGKKSNETYRET